VTTDPSDALSLPEMQKHTGEKQRAIQHWTAKGVLEAETIRGREGTQGSHRRYDKGEVIYALIAGALNRRKLPVSEILAITNSIRATTRAIRAAAKGSRDPALAAPLYNNHLVKVALRGEHPVFAIVERGKGGPKLILHAVGAPRVDRIYDIPIPWPWFDERLESKLLDPTFNLTAADIIRLDKVLERARGLFPGKTK